MASGFKKAGWRGRAWSPAHSSAYIYGHTSAPSFFLEVLALNKMRTFYIVWIGQLFSTIGSGLTGFGAGVWLYQETGSATLFALNTVAYTLPRIVLSPVAGVFADRYNRRWIMLISDFLAAVSTLLLGFLFLNGVLHYWHIYLISAINSAANTFQSPAYQ